MFAFAYTLLFVLGMVVDKLDNIKFCNNAKRPETAFILLSKYFSICNNKEPIYMFLFKLTRY